MSDLTVVVPVPDRSNIPLISVGVSETPPDLRGDPWLILKFLFLFFVFLKGVRDDGVTY